MKNDRVVCLASGGGRTVENLVRLCRSGALSAEIQLVIASSGKAGVVKRAQNLDLNVLVIDKSRYESLAHYHGVLIGAVLEARPDWVVLAGWLQLFPVPPALEGRVINIHPALLPAYGGKGYYGDRVHQAVAKDGCSMSGCTVHFATEEYDQGPILLQEAVEIPVGTSAEQIAELVFEAEKRALPQALEALISGTALWEDGEVQWRKD
jgi:formyltetrahydrofolate-dependent phosphoribosylglycinamide formyltransferase